MRSTAIVFLPLAFFVILQDGAAAAENETDSSNISSADTNKTNSDITKKICYFLDPAQDLKHCVRTCKELLNLGTPFGKECLCKCLDKFKEPDSSPAPSGDPPSDDPSSDDLPSNDPPSDDPSPENSLSKM